MERIQELIRFLEDLNRSIDDIVMKILKDNKSKIEGLNLSQLEHGLNADGVDISSYKPYAEFTKRRKGQTLVDLLDSGDFYGGWETDYDKNSISLFSTDRKAQELEIIYGLNIYGLTEDNIDKLRILVKNQLINEIRKN